MPINYISNTRWNSILTKLNTKRTDAGSLSISHTFEDWIKQSDIDTLRNGTIDILTTYGYSNLTDALNNVGYAYSTWKTWTQNWISDISLDEIEDILDSMIISLVKAEHGDLTKSSSHYPGGLILDDSYEEAYQTGYDAPDVGFTITIENPDNADGHNLTRQYLGGGVYKYYCQAMKRAIIKLDVSSYNYGKIEMDSIYIEKKYYQESGMENLRLSYTTLSYIPETDWYASGTLGLTVTATGWTPIIDVTSWVNAQNRIDIIGNIINFAPDGGSPADPNVVQYMAIWLFGKDINFRIFTHT